MEETNEIKLKRLKKINGILTIIQIIVITLILGLYIFYNMNEKCNDSSKPMVVLDEQQIRAAFNGKFTQYIGKNKSLPMVKSLITSVLANNATNEQRQVTINNETNIKDMIFQASSLIQDNYTITVDMNLEGYVNNINIMDSKGNPIFEEDNNG